MVFRPLARRPGWPTGAPSLAGWLAMLPNDALRRAGATSKDGRARARVVGVAWLMLGVLVGVGGCGWCCWWLVVLVVMFGVGYGGVLVDGGWYVLW